MDTQDPNILDFDSDYYEIYNSLSDGSSTDGTLYNSDLSSFSNDSTVVDFLRRGGYIKKFKISDFYENINEEDELWVTLIK